MGTGSFGGGSGGFGGGASGGRGFGGASASTTARRLARGDTVFRRIRALLSLTDEVNEHDSAEEARATVVGALATRPRQAYVREILGDGFVQAVYRDLLELQRSVATGFDWATIARKYGLGEERASLRRLCACIVTRHQNASTDERFVEIVRSSTRDLLLKAVHDDPDLYYQEQEPRQLGNAFRQDVLQNTAGRFIANILLEIVRRDILSLSDAAKVALGEVVLEIGTRWCDVFKRQRSAGQQFRDLFTVISSDPDSFPVKQ